MIEDRLTLRVANELTETARAGEAVEAFCERNGVPAAAAYHLALALDEALVNTISYGFPEGGHREITVELARRGEDIVIELVDDGVAYNPLEEAPEPDLTSTLQERRIGGLGVHMIKTFMTEAAYSREDGKNRLRLRKHFEPED